MKRKKRTNTPNNYYIGYSDKGLKKSLFLGSNDAFFSDFQSAHIYKKREADRILPETKRRYNNKKLKVIKIDMKIS